MYKQRASASGNITSQPRTKKDKEAGNLSKTTESLVQDWLKESIYGIKKEFSSKYTDKGNLLEYEAIEMAIEWLGLDFLTKKNEEYFEDEFFTGTPDLILEDEIIDIKCSWDAFTFPLFENELPEKNYFYQLQVYLHLTGKKKGRVVYVLVNTPEELMRGQPEYDYSETAPEFRIKTFDVDYDPEVIEFLQSQIIKIRTYINQLKF